MNEKYTIKVPEHLLSGWSENFKQKLPPREWPEILRIAEGLPPVDQTTHTQLYPKRLPWRRGRHV